MLIPSSYCCTDDQCPAASERSPCYAQLIDIEVEPASQLSLALEQNAHLQRLERCFRNCPGYLSASLHPSEDGQHVLNYTCWRSREDCERAWQAREDAQGPLSAGVWRLGAIPAHSSGAAAFGSSPWGMRRTNLAETTMRSE